MTVVEPGPGPGASNLQPPSEPAQTPSAALETNLGTVSIGGAVGFGLWPLGVRGVVPEGDLGIRRKEGNSRENPVARRFGMMVGPFLGELDGSRELGLPKAPGSRPAPRSRAQNSGPRLLFASARGLSGPQGAPAWAQHGGVMILQPNLPSPCLLTTRICMNSTHSHAHRGQRAQV